MEKTPEEIRVENNLSKLKAINEEIAQCDKYTLSLSLRWKYRQVALTVDDLTHSYQIDHNLCDNLRGLLLNHFTERRAALFAQASQIMKS